MCHLGTIILLLSCQIKVLSIVVVLHMSGQHSWIFQEEVSAWNRKGVLQDFFRVGKVLQVDFTVTIDENHGCKKIFWIFHLFHPPPGVWKFGKSLYRGQYSKLSQTYGVTYQNLCEKGTKPTKKLELNRTYQLREKSKKPPEMRLFWKTVFSGGFWDFSPNW